jgi:hypothetical protein
LLLRTRVFHQVVAQRREAYLLRVRLIKEAHRWGRPPLFFFFFFGAV